MNLPSLEVNLIPTKAILLAHSHARMKREEEMWQELRKALFDGLAKELFLLIGEEAYPPIPFRLAADTRSRIPVNLLVIDSHPKNEGERRLPSISAAGRPIARSSLLF